MENPFIFGKVVKGAHFTDREREVAELTDDLKGGQNVLLFSPRRYGKTSLILKVRDRLAAEGLLVAYVDFFPIGTKNQLAEAYAKALLKSTRGKVDDAIAFAQGLFSRLRASITIRPDGMPELELTVSDAGDINRALDEVMESAERIAVKKKRRLVVVFDEFQEFEKIDPDFDNRLRAVIQHHANVGYVFMGSKRHLIEKLFFKKDRALYQSAKPFPLAKIPVDDFTSYIRSRFKKTSIAIGGGMIGRILDVTGAHPYYTQQLCHEVWNGARDERRVTEEVIDKAVQSVIDTQSYAYSEMWDCTTAKQRALLGALSVEPGAGILSADFVRRFSLGATSNVQYSAKVLAEKQLIERVNGGWAITDVFFQRWILQKAADL
ncbi:MAG: AAA family ATPase [Candidatus Aquicultorales bacterium]